MDEEKFKEIIHQKSQELKELRQQVKIKDEQIAGLRSDNLNLGRKLLQFDQTITQMKQKKAELSEDVFIAYEQRARLLEYFTTFLPSVIKYDLDAPNPDFANVLYIVLPCIGQISFHLWVGHLDFFKEVPRQGFGGKWMEPWGGNFMQDKATREGTVDLIWDNHDNLTKWDRFHRYCDSHQYQPIVNDLDTERSAWYATNEVAGAEIGKE